MLNFIMYKGVQIMETKTERTPLEYWVGDEEWEFNNQFGLKTLQEAKEVIDNLKK